MEQQTSPLLIPLISSVILVIWEVPGKCSKRTPRRGLLFKMYGTFHLKQKQNQIYQFLKSIPQTTNLFVQSLFCIEWISQFYSYYPKKICTLYSSISKKKRSTSSPPSPPKTRNRHLQHLLLQRSGHRGDSSGWGHRRGGTSETITITSVNQSG